MEKVILALAIGLGLWAQGDPFAGSFAGEGVRVELRPAGPGAYAGTLHVQGQALPLTGRMAGGVLKGAFIANGNSFDFQAATQNGQLRLVSEGNEYVLAREGGRAAAHVHSKGFSIQPAAGWTAQNIEQGIQLVPAGAAPGEGYIAAIQDGYSAAEEARTVQQLSQAFLQNGGQAGRAGQRRQDGAVTSYAWEAMDPSSGKLAALKIYLIPAGNRANLLVAFGHAERVGPRDGELRQMITTLRPAAVSAAARPASAPAAGGALADNTPLAQQWLQKLRGKMIRQFYASQGMSSDKRHYLNADGTYSYRRNSMVAIDVPGASASSIGNNNSAGRWRIRDVGGQVVLEVHYNSGETGQFPITQDARNWYLNGEKAFAVEPE